MEGSHGDVVQEMHNKTKVDIFLKLKIQNIKYTNSSESKTGTLRIYPVLFVNPRHENSLILKIQNIKVQEKLHSA